MVRNQADECQQHQDALNIGRSGTPAAAWIARLDEPLATCSEGGLAGLRFAVKDNMDVEGLLTTAACPAFTRRPAVHALVVQKLLDAGAQLQGKTNLDQFACGLNGTRSPYGEVPNAFDARFVSGGSSSGSAYVVASGEVDFALGTDTAGSGRVPAGLNNIVGIKPSRGLVSTTGVLPAAQSADCVSIFARTVALGVKVLMTMVDADPRDPFSRAPTLLRREPFPSIFRFGMPDTLEFFGDVQAEAAFEQAVQQLRALGGKPVRIDYTPLAATANLLYGSALVAERYVAIREFFDVHADAVIEPVRSILAQGRQYSAADLYEAQLQLRVLAQQVQPMWSSIDVMLVPTAPTHFTRDAMRADPIACNRQLGIYTNFVNLLDYAAISVPSSLRPDGLPFGITLIAPAGSDLALAELGQRFHHASALPQGATGQSLPPPVALPLSSGTETVRVAVVGAHLSGMPLNGQLTERGARLLTQAHTAPHYRLYALPGSQPPKPGLLRVAPGEGAAIAIEVWEMLVTAYGSFVALIPSPMCIGTLLLADGSVVQGFVCEAQALSEAEDITHLGGWRAYIARQTELVRH